MLTIDCKKMQARTSSGGTPLQDVTRLLTYRGSGSRFLDLYPNEQVKITATGTGSPYPLPINISWGVNATPCFV